ncbi:MAG: HAD family phosphatase [archaeon]
MIKCVIFDLDGVIVDTNPLHFEAWNSAFKSRYNKEIDKDKFSSSLGAKSEHVIKILSEDLSIKYIDITTLLNKKSSFFNNMKKKIKLKRGVVKALDLIKENELKIALATGGKKTFIEYVFNRFSIGSYFDYYISGDDVKKAKPDPEIFLRCADYLKFDHKNCVVIEDSNLGIIAAKRAGMKVIAIPDELTINHDYAKADIILTSLSDLDMNVFDAL